MNKTVAEAAEFIDALLPRIAATQSDVVICPPFTALPAVVERRRDRGQGRRPEHARGGVGAFTGEVSAPMLVELGVEAVILGHSERRQLFGETDEALARKVPAALAAGLEPILCVGETEEARDAGETEAVLERQVQADLAGGRGAATWREVVIAYEPIWAIGTGRTATPEQAQEACAFIRDVLPRRAAPPPTSVRILYGGSVKPANAAELMAQPDIDGALVGGAGLDPEDFAAIVEAAGEPTHCVPSLALVILDGWGLAAARPRQRDLAGRDAGLRLALGRAIPHTQLSAQGRDVGLPEGQMGNSEVGHLNLGAGAVVKQDLARIDDADRRRQLLRERGAAGGLRARPQQPSRPPAPARAGLRRRRPLRLGAHRGCIELAAAGGRAGRRLPRLHRRPRHAPARRPRDTWPSSSAGCARPAGSAPSAAATTRWTATPAGSGSSSPTTRSSTPRACGADERREAVEASYERGETDEFVRPTVIGGYDGVADGDVAIFFNFRPDRARELTRALAEPGFDGSPAPAARLLDLTTMTEYRKGWPYPVAFPEERRR